MSVSMVVRTEEQLRRAGRAIARQYTAHKEGGILIEFGPYKPPKTYRQMSKLHSMLHEIAAHTGDTFDSVRTDFKELYGPRETSKIDPSKTYPRSWKKLSKEEAGALIERAYQLGAELGVVFQEPT